MKFLSAELFRYKLPLRMPLPLKQSILKEREGFVIKLLDSEGSFSYGEIAPLSGWHSECLSNALNQIQELLPQFIKNTFPPKTADLLTELRKRCGQFKLFSSVCWGIESAILQRHLTRKGISFAHLLGDNFQKKISVNALLSTHESSIIDHAIVLFSKGYHTFKIKVGRESIQKEVEILKDLRSAIGPDSIIRLDANRNWTISEALQFANALKDIRIEYIEEPTHQIEQIQQFYQETGLPVALDETLNGKNPENLNLSDGVKVLVIKPTFMGGITKFFEWIRFAKKHELSIVLSSAFESGFTLSILAELAALTNPGELAMGLQTFDWLAQDLVDPRFEAVNGRVNIMEIPAAERLIDEKQLQLIKKTQLK